MLDLAGVVERGRRLGLFVVGLPPERRVMSATRPLKIAIVAGEESGDLLGADIVARAAGADRPRGQTCRRRRPPSAGARPEAAVRCRRNRADGLFSAVVRDLPRLIRRIGETARAIVAETPDCLITIDSPDFTLRVAKKVRAANPAIPIVHYVCPSVWAWRPGRAPAMKPYVDHILCILPFEPAELAAPRRSARHLCRPSADQRSGRACGRGGCRPAPRDLSADREKTLLLLPGSRKGEVSRLIGPFGETVSVLRARGHGCGSCCRPSRMSPSSCGHRVAGWAQKPEIVVDAAGKWQAFGEADAALIASGTVSLELALAGVPLVSCYKLDPFARADPEARSPSGRRCCRT